VLTTLFTLWAVAVLVPATALVAVISTQAVLGHARRLTSTGRHGGPGAARV
jgi:hypothetical protein